jgi:hypothetical protein
MPARLRLGHWSGRPASNALHLETGIGSIDEAGAGQRVCFSPTGISAESSPCLVSYRAAQANLKPQPMMHDAVKNYLGPSLLMYGPSRA